MQAFGSQMVNELYRRLKIDEPWPSPGALWYSPRMLETDTSPIALLPLTNAATVILVSPTVLPTSQPGIADRCPARGRLMLALRRTATAIRDTKGDVRKAFMISVPATVRNTFALDCRGIVLDILDNPG